MPHLTQQHKSITTLQGQLPLQLLLPAGLFLLKADFWVFRPEGATRCSD